jgi:S-formylglutathione hydrolase FrmB
MRDVTFHSTALNRDMQYRVFLPSDIPPGQKLSVVYLLHGGGGNFRDWSNYSDGAEFAAPGLILVMPEGESSYYVNSAEHSQDRYEDYITKDVISDVEARFPVAGDRAHRAIAGVSMGGYGAINIALKHPELFVFAGGLSPALDVPSRPFSWKRFSQSRRFESIFGPWKSEARRANDPFVEIRSVDPTGTPFLFMTAGSKKASYRQAANSRQSLKSDILPMSSTPGPAATIGINGTAGFLSFSRVLSNTSHALSLDRWNGHQTKLTMVIDHSTIFL